MLDRVIRLDRINRVVERKQIAMHQFPRLLFVLPVILLFMIGLPAAAMPAPGKTSAGTSQTASAVNAPAIEYVNSLQGNIAAAAIAGNTAYVIDGNTLAVLDVSNPAALVLRGRVPIQRMQYDDVDVAAAGNWAYVVVRKTLSIIDASNATAPILVANYLSSLVYLASVQVIGSRAYLISPDGFEIVDIGDPAHPRFLGKYEGSFANMQVVGNLAYGFTPESGPTNFGSKLTILDMSDPAHGVVVSSFALSIYGYLTGGVTIADGRAYLNVGAEDKIHLLTIDVRNPAGPALLANAVVGGNVAAVSGNIAYLIYFHNLTIWDISDPSNPIRRSTPPIKVSKIQIANGLTYISYPSGLPEQSGGLWILDVSDPSQPIVRGSYAGFNINGIAMAAGGNLAYVVGDKIQVLDLTNPISPTLRGSYAEANWNKSVYVAGTNLYAASKYRTTNDELRIFDVANSDAPVLQSSTELSGTVAAIVVENNLAFVLSYITYVDQYKPIVTYSTDFSIFDISNSASPLLRGRISSITGRILELPGSIGLVGSLAYVATGGTLAIIDVGDPTNPLIRTQYDTPGQAQDLQLVGDLAYVADGGAGLTILNIQNRLNPTIIGRYPGYAKCVQMQGNLAYLCSYPGLLLVDVSNPAEPRPRARYDGISGPLQVVGDLIYVAGGEGGLQILRLHPDRFPPPAFVSLIRA